MTKYICKCGKEIQKSTNAASTGNRLENYGPGHECYGCPFVISLKEYGGGGVQIVGHECRTSKTIDYTTYADLKLGTSLCGKIRGLDLEFLKEVRDYADLLDGINKDRYAFIGRPAEYGADGRFTLTIMVDPNKKGQEAKKKLFEAFFDENGRRLDMSPEAEEDYIKIWIKDRIQEEKLVMVDMHEAPGLEADELPVDEIEEQTEIPELEEEPTEAVMEQIEDALDEEPAPVQISGRRVSILNREFETVVSKIDEVIGQSLCKAMAGERQGFTLTAKIVFTPSGARFSVSHDVRSKMDPVEIKEKGRLYEAIAIALDENGTPIIPDGSSSQITMDEITAGATVTTEADGVVQAVELNDEDLDRIFPCNCTECPLHTGFTGGEAGCSFGGSVDSPLDDDLKGHIYDAVTEHRCTRGCINEICEREFPAEQSEPDPYPCEEVDCWMNNEGDPPCCHLDPFGGNEPVATGNGDYVDAVIDFHCTRKCVLDRYNKIEGGDQHD